ncbi:S-adenosyl-L-methionine-dependent methyltransferase [Ramaria rubella]|nr:S-adenosyl-L-methionine-dependent methyltransferase [Ramaria rubella]
MSGTPKDIVKEGYNVLSLLYRQDDEEPPNYKRWLNLILSFIPPPPVRILDFGCGCGVPLSRDLANAGYSVIGVDISPVQVNRAGVLVPDGTFIEADIMSPSLHEQFTTKKFSAIIGLYVLIHIPRDEQPILIHRLVDWMTDDGLCALITGVVSWTGEVNGWLGSDESTKMWWEQLDADDYRKWFHQAGLEVIFDEYIPEEESDGHQLFLLKKMK